jgi:glycosyltransferase involved in cell wall biosynthesis
VSDALCGPRDISPLLPNPVGDPYGSARGVEPPYGGPWMELASPYHHHHGLDRSLSCYARPGVGPAAPKNTPLRIVHVGQSLVRVGGIETCLKGLIRHLDPRRARLVKCIVTPTDNFDPSAAADLGVPVEVGGAECVRQAAREADVLLCWGPRDLGAWLADCPPPLCVFVAHGEGFWTRWILEGCSKIIDHVIAVSRRVQDKVCSGFPSTVVPNGVDAAHLAPTRSPAVVRASLGFEREDFVLGFAGRFSPEKRAHLLIEAVARLPRQFKALLVGAGPLRADLLERANRLIPGRYAFATGVTMGDYYGAMDALCLPSEEEGYAMVILEAMLCERPVMATPVGCVPEVFQDRVNGLTVSGTVDSLCEAATLLERHPAWRRGLAAEARAFAQENGYAATMARRYEDLLLQLWQEKHPHTGAPG